MFRGVSLEACPIQNLSPTFLSRGEGMKNMTLREFLSGLFRHENVGNNDSARAKICCSTTNHQMELVTQL